MAIRTNVRIPLAVISLAAISLAAIPLTATAQSACIDSDGDGWGWDGSQSCVVTQAVVTQTSVACLDPDGDGYGWDGNATCLITQGNQNQTLPSTDEAVCVDNDGDGWGWNGVSSCRVDESSSNVQPVVPPVSGGAAGASAFRSNIDLVALHFDHAPDRDDGHAAVAALMVKNQLGLNVSVVAGTYGEYSKNQYDAASEAVMNAVWGSEWLNAHRNFEGAVNATVARWASVLGAGGSIWVAEGGPSDFTSEVVRRIRQSHSEFATGQRIHVIQHSQWNEDHALRSKLAYTKANTRYVFIADGNDPNATADLRFESHNNGAFVSRALSGRYANEWAVAFNYLSPSEKLDFSDAVELLHIVGLGTSVIADVNDFGDYFF